MELTTLAPDEETIEEITSINSIWGSLAPFQHTIIGVYLIFVGVSGLLDNLAILISLVRFKKVFSSPHYLAIFHLCIADVGICTLSGFPFSGVSSLSGRWLYGDKGCQFYAFNGFFFGNANILMIAILAFSRYISLHPQPKMKFSEKTIYRCVVFAWFTSLVMAVAPLLGWASYGYEPSVTTCTINWRNNDASYISYMIFLTLTIMGIPLFVIPYCYYHSFNMVKKSSTDKMNAEKNAIKMGSILGIAFFTLWGLYAILCFWTIFGTVESVPMILTVLPPLLAKITPVLNPLVIFYFDPKLRGAAWSTLTCKPAPADLLPSPESTKMTE